MMYKNRKTFRNIAKYMTFCYKYGLTNSNSFQERLQDKDGYYVVLHYNKNW